MKISFPVLFLAATFCCFCEIHAQGTLYYSDLTNPSVDGAAPVDNSSYLGQVFETGNNPLGYDLNYIQLAIADALGSPAGFTVSLYSQNNFAPGQFLAALTGSSNPSTAGFYFYTAPGIYLAPSTEYCIVVAASTPYPAGTYYWNNGFAAGGIDGWQNVASANSSDGVSWSENSRDYFESAIYATAVPEPSVWILLPFSGIFIAMATGRGFGVRRLIRQP